ncbi:MAG TPA: HEAT repeat domain-containing protein [Nitrospira sp.]|nr:HEAT repeat domain-containing protein [Nitrospira sp.]
MKILLRIMLVMALALLNPAFAGTTSLSGKGPLSDQSANPPPQPPPLTKREVVKKYVKDCGKKTAKETNCGALRKDTVEIVKDSVLTLGSSAKRVYVPTLAKFFKSDEVVLRIAAADAIGMIGPQDQDVEALAPGANDPVPDVRRAVSQAVARGKGPAISLLAQRLTLSHKTGLTPEVPPDAGKFAMPVAPDSVYLFDSSDATKGRLSYVVRGKSDPAQFFKAKAKKGPFKLDQFKEQYRYQLQDDEEALNQAQQAAGKQLENEKPPDPTNLQAFTDYMQRMQAVSMQGSAGRMYFDSYQSNLYGAPTVYVLEERQIGQRSYPTRYVVVYQELAFKRPGYRLNWTTVADDALKAAQVASLKEQREEEALKATIKREDEAAKKREAELDALTKKKDAAEKKQFKKGQTDLEKELGF